MVDPPTFSASFDVSGVPVSWVEGVAESFPVVVTNTGNQVWHASGVDRVRLASHFASKSGADPAFWLSDQLVVLAGDVAPGSSVSVQITVAAPVSARFLEVEMVAEDSSRTAQFAELAVGVSPQVYSATYGVADVPVSWATGQSQSFPVVVTNTGNQPWPSTGTNRVRLGAHFASAAGGTSTAWLSDVRVALAADLAPGASVTVQATATAPATGGGYVLEFGMVKEGQFWFPQYADVSVVATQPRYAATYGLSAVPASWVAGQSQTFPVTVTNTGNQSWPSTGTARVRLGVHFASQPGGTGVAWLSDARVELTSDVAPGASVTLQVTVTAPASAQVLEFQMTKETQFWFPQFADVNVAASLPAAYSATYGLSSVPAVWSTNQTQTFPVTVTNTGNQTWPATGTTRARLGVHFAIQPGGTATPWLNDIRVALPADLAPGASVTLQVTVAAPALAQVLEFQMVKETQFWFPQFADVGIGAPAPVVYSATYGLSGVPASWVAGQAQTFPVTVTNTGNQIWPSTGTNGVRLAVHFASQPGGTATPWLNDIRVALPTDLAPGASATLDVTATALGSARVLEFELVKEGQFYFSQLADVGVGVQVPGSSIDVWSSVLGLSAAATKVMLSPSAGWRLVQTNTDLYRSTSSNGPWQRIGLPPGKSGTGQVTIGNDGVVYMLSDDGGIYPTKQLYRFATEWVGPFLLLTNPSSVYAGAGALATDGVKLVAVEARTGRTAVSTNNGNTWTTTASVYPTSHGYEVTVLGGYMHVLANLGTGSQVYQRFSLTSNTVINTVTGIAGWSAKVMALPGSPTTLFIATGYPTGTGTISTSTNSGATWTTLVTNDSAPTRAGVVFGVPVIGADGLLRSYGSTIEAGVVAVYHAAFDPVAQMWGQVQRTQSTASSGALVVWPTQRTDSTISPSVLWVMRPSGSAFWAVDASTGSVSNSWVTTTSMSSGTTVLDELTSAPTKVVLSPSGAWTLVQTNTNLYRSASASGVWEKIGRPPGKSSTGRVAISDDGTVFSLQYNGDAYPTKQLYRFSGEWFGPSLLLANPSTVNASAGGLVTDGTKLIAVELRTGRTAVSTNNGNTWTTTGSVYPSDYGYDLTIVGGYLHVLSNVGNGSQVYKRFSLTSNTVTNTLTGIPGFSAELMSSPGSVSHLWITSPTGPLLLESTDSGATWATTANGPATAAISTFGRADTDVAGFGLATCSSGSFVYDVTHVLDSTGVWSAPNALALGADQAAGVVSTRDRTDGLASEAGHAWVSFSDGSTWSLERIDPARLTPEGVFGVDGYGLTARGVSLAIAGLVHTETDVAIAGVGPRLELTRTYNSQDRRVGVFGRGWTSSYETRAYENCVTKDVTVLRGDGRREFFRWNGTNGYLTPSGYTASLVKTGTTGWVLNEANGYVSTFRSDGRLTSIADADNQKLNLVWNGSNQLTSVTDQVTGRALTFTYAGSRVSSMSTSTVTGPGYSGPLTWNYVYSGTNLAKVCEPRNNDPLAGSCIGYTVTGGRITQITDRNGHVDRKVGYVAGQLSWTEDGLGNRTSYTYPTPSKTVVTDANSHSTTSEFDSQFRLVKQTNAAGAVTTFEYDTAGFRNKTTDPTGGVTSQTFDAKGNVLSETNPAGFTRYMAYDAFNNLIQSRDARSANAVDNTYLTTTTWDGVGRNKLSESTPPTAQQPLGTTLTWAFTSGSEPAIGGGTTPKGLLKTATDALGSIDTYGYDSLGNLRDTVDRAGLHSTYTYDGLGRPISQTVFPTSYPGGVVTLFEYDQLGNLVGQIDPAATNAVTGELHQHTTVSTYDGVSNLLDSVETDVGGSGHPDLSRLVEYTYDAADRPISSTDPEGGVTLKEYDAVGNLTATIDARGVRREMTYDERNLAITTIVKDAVFDVGVATARDVIMSVAGYDAAGRQVTSIDARGVTVTLAYDANGQVTSKTLNDYHDRNGSTRDVVLQATTYDPAGNPLTQTTGNGLRTEVFDYDAAGRMVSATLDPAGLDRTTTIVYDRAGNIVRRTLTDGARTEETRLSYDAASRVVSSTVENGATDLTTSYTRDNRGSVVSMVEPRGNVAGGTPATYRIDYQFDALGRATVTTSPPVSVTEDGVTTPAVRPETTSGYDTYGQTTEYLDERANLTSTTFDRLGRVTLIVHPESSVSGGATVAPTEEFEFDTVGNLVSRTDRRGETTTFTYDGLNRAITQTDPAVGNNPAGVLFTAYDDSGNTTLTIDQLGARAEATYDDAGRQRTATSVVRNATPTPASYTTTYDYDDLGNQTFEQTPTGDVARWEYSAASELTTQIDASLSETVTAYDVAGRAISITDPLGRTTTYDYDLAGRQTAQHDFAPDSTPLTTSTTAYDAAGNLIASTTPRGVASGNPAAYTTSYTYDPISRLTTVAQPTSTSHVVQTAYSYDAAGNHTAMTDGRGYTTSYQYNEWNLQTAVIEPATPTFPGAADRTWTTEYDPAGLAVRLIEPGAITVDRSFDQLGRLTSETGTGADVTAATRTFAYDTSGQRVSAGSQAGDIGFIYDDRGLLTQTTGPTQYQSNFTYDPAGRMLTRTDAAGTTSYTWNTRGQLASITDALTGSSRTNTFDVAGQLVDVAYSGGATRTVGYDDLGQVTSDEMKTAGGTVTAGYSYSYNPDGNLTEVTANLPGNPATGTNHYSYDNAGRLASWDNPANTTVTYNYDDSGNLINNAGVAATFDARNQLQTTGTATYQWTPRGNLASVTDGGSTTASTFDALNRNTATGTTSYTYDSLDRAATNGPTQFAYAGAEIDPVAIGTTRFARSPAGLPIAAQTGTDPAVLLGRNTHGDIGYQHQPDGTINATRAYDPFGDTIGETGTLTPLGYQSDYTDPTTGDIWMGARWYRPGTATFTNRDTILGQLQTPISLNRYTYAYGDPLGMWDPDGRNACNNVSEQDTDAYINFLIESGGTAGCAKINAESVITDVIVGTLTFVGQAAASTAGGLICGAAVTAVTANPVLGGAAAGACGGAASRAWTAAAAGGGWDEMADAALTKDIWLDAAAGGIGGGVSSWLGGANPAATGFQRITASGASSTASGAIADGFGVALNGGSAIDILNAIVNPERRYKNLLAGTAGGAADVALTSRNGTPHTQHRPGTRTRATNSRALVDAGKYDYLFGNVSSNSHNLARSLQNQRQLNGVGVFDNAAGRDLLSAHFDEVVSTNSNVLRTWSDEFGTFQARESLLAGPNGLLKLESTWQVTNDGLRLTTVIPFGGG